MEDAYPLFRKDAVPDLAHQGEAGGGLGHPVTVPDLAQQEKEEADLDHALAVDTVPDHARQEEEEVELRPEMLILTEIVVHPRHQLEEEESLFHHYREEDSI